MPPMEPIIPSSIIPTTIPEYPISIMEDPNSPGDEAIKTIELMKTIPVITPTSAPCIAP